MDNRTVRDAFQAAKTLGNVPGHRAALQSMRLQRDLEEGERVEEQRKELVRAELGLEEGEPVAGVELDPEDGARLEEEVAAFLDAEAETDPGDVREIELDAFMTEDGAGFPLGGNALTSLIDAGAVDEAEALAALEETVQDEAEDG